VLWALVWLCAAVVARASEQHGVVTFNGLPVPGATITATQGAKKLSTVTDADGSYAFADLPDGTWKIDVEMPLFATIRQEIAVAPKMPGIRWELKMLPLDQVMAKARAVQPAVGLAMNEAESATPSPAKPSATKPKADAGEAPKPPPVSSAADDGLLVNGSVNNAATSPFSLAEGFGNTRKGSKGLYTGGIGVIYDNSATDARPYSLTGLDTPKATYSTITGIATIGGPIRIPHVLARGPNFFVAYQWTRNGIATIDSGLVPTLAQRSVTPVNPVAEALLALYPLPNIAGNANYNYQTGILSNTHEDAMQSRMDKNIGHRDEVYGTFAFQSERADNISLFDFRDTTGTLGINAAVTWQRRFNHGIYTTLGYRLSRLRTLITPYFANGTNIEGNAGIGGTDQSPIDWGPPTLVFSSGIATLTDAQSAFDRNLTNAIAPSAQFYRGRHNITVGMDFRRQEFNYLSQQDPRGTFTFTGAATGTDFTDFLTGIPDTSSIAYGNADKYLRQSVYDAYIDDDWHLRPELTVNAGLRWEYGAPITELKNRLVNLDVTPGFTAVAPVLASDPVGPLTGQHYPTSLIRPDYSDFEPRVGISWRPIPGSSVVVRSGYGIYADTSVYQATALLMAQQSPLSDTLSAINSSGCPLTLTSGLIRKPCTATTPNTFAIDPNFRVGYAQTWQLAVQRDLPQALQVTVTYLGVKGTRGVQEFLPNTYPLGGANPCPLCPSGFAYRTSNGASSREAGSVQVRRRLRSGFAALLLYTYSKSIDDDAVLGGQGPVAAGAVAQPPAPVSIAQDWLDLSAERGLSTFDQRQLLTTSFQYTTGTGQGGGTLMNGWRGRVYKEWTASGQIVAGTGLPETPVFLAATNGTGIYGNLRPDRTSVSVYAAPKGYFLNAAAYTVPRLGQWGDAGRDSITGPGALTFNGSLSRTFRIGKLYNLDLRVDATNLLNHPVYTSYNTTIDPTLVSPIFGLAASTNPMRSLQTTARFRF
jgi:hypothetical protein